jgi:hypothetical protein
MRVEHGLCFQRLFWHATRVPTLSWYPAHVPALSTEQVEEEQLFLYS